MITFYPGPSRLYDSVPGFMQEACAEGILSMNHRSAAFEALMQQTCDALRRQLQIPADYSIYFTSSATECWEIVVQSLVKKQSTHYYNGAFGEKWAEYARKILGEVQTLSFEINEVPDIAQILALGVPEVLCLTHNETSNGTMLPVKFIEAVRQEFPETLVAIDATSSLGGVPLNFKMADVWLASVQKCLGLPSGLGVLVCSPQAVERARQLGKNKHYNSLLFLEENALKYQSAYTPNTLGIYLLCKTLQTGEEKALVYNRLEMRLKDWYAFLAKFSDIEDLIWNEKVRSGTVLAITASEANVQRIKSLTREKGIQVGNGYGKWKNHTFRIANFPAIADHEIKALQQLLEQIVR